MTKPTSNNKRIAKNTLLLYFRMTLTMIVSLYTSRVVLEALGIEDYGIYNAVGTFVAMFNMLSGSLSSAISRFITFELGKEKQERLKNIFSSAVTIQIILALIILLLAETIGLWFLNNKMVIPDDRIIAANWVYQFSIIAFGFNLISIPYNAAIIAHERMSAFAYIGIIEVTGKLLTAISLTVCPIDRLVFYGFSLTLIALIIRLIYGYYCKKHFTECSFQPTFDKSLLKEMFNFAGWNFIGASSAVLRDQGGNIIINLFCGPAVNAARAIAIQVSSTIQGFVSNFMTALNPQITKSFAAGNHKYMMTLIFQGARLSFYILLLLSLPIILNAHSILHLWLGGIVPEHTTLFVQLVLIFAMSEALANPLITAMLATGQIRNYQLVVGGLQLMNLPVSYILLHTGYPPECVFITAIIISVCCEMARLYMLHSMIKLPVRQFLRNVYFNVIGVFLIAAIVPYLVINNIEKDLINLILTSILCITCSIISILYIGCNKEERKLIAEKLRILQLKIKKQR